MPEVRVLPENDRGGPVKGNMLEMFRSWQGEGPYAGVRQIFVRLSGCHLRCGYCDTPESWTRSKTWTCGGETFANPADSSDVIAVVRKWAAREKFHSVSFTGGEPLLQPGFLRELALETRKGGLETYIDTSATLPRAFEKVADAFDYFALDYKLPSTPGVEMREEEFAACLALARGKRFVKIVTTADARLDEIARAARIIAREGRDIPVILQIATPVNPETVPPGENLLARARRSIEKEGLPVLVLPQLHVLAGWK